MAEERAQRRLAAILAADVAGYARLVGADEVGTLTALQDIWSERLKPLLVTYHGRVVKLMGDGVLLEFASAVDAVECAVAFQEAMAVYNNARRDNAPIEFRIGVNLGDIVIYGDDILGDGVNVAARLESHAPKNGILISDAVHVQIAGKVAAAFTQAGELLLKNIATPVRAWRWGGGEAYSSAVDPGKLPSIAILPFANLSGDPEQEFFADGLVEDIITTLSKLSGVLVIARNSSDVYKDRAIDIRKVAAELGVRYVLEGSIRKNGPRMRISVQLIDAVTGAHVWGERYDRTIADIFAIQDEITLILATEMQVNLMEGEQARLRYTTTSNVEAWNFWARGLSHFRQAVTKDKVGAARPHWEKALALDPASAALNAMLGFVHYFDARFGWWDDRETALGRATAYADRALELDPNNADAHTTSGVVLMLKRRFDEALAHARKAVQLAPGSADAAIFACLVLASSALLEEAVVQGERAMILSPHHPPYYLGILGNAYRLSGRIEEGIAAFRAYHARSPGFGLADLVITYQQSGRLAQATRLAEELLAIRRSFTIAAWLNTQFRRDTEQLEADAAALRAAGLPAG